MEWQYSLHAIRPPGTPFESYQTLTRYICPCPQDRLNTKAPFCRSTLGILICWKSRSCHPRPPLDSEDSINVSSFPFHLSNYLGIWGIGYLKTLICYINLSSEMKMGILIKWGIFMGIYRGRHLNPNLPFQSPLEGNLVCVGPDLDDWSSFGILQVWEFIFSFPRKDWSGKLGYWNA